jgi:serine protease Do
LQGTRRDASGEIRLGDVIVAVDGQAVANADDLNSILGQHKIGDAVTLAILRDGARRDIRVTLGST